MIHGGGALVLGQDQDIVGESFRCRESFLGEMTGSQYLGSCDRGARDQEHVHVVPEKGGERIPVARLWDSLERLSEDN